MLAAPVIEPTRAPVRLPVSRRRLLLAWMCDLATLLLALAVSALVSVLWMLARTDRGRLDLGTGDAVFALALGLAVGPAWTAWQWLQLWSEGGTLGQRCTRAAAGDGLGAARIQLRSPLRCGVWLALHPVSVPLWAWLTAVFLVTATPVFMAAAAVLLALLLLVTLLGIVSLVLLLIRPSMRPLHLWIACASFGRRR